MGISNRGKIKWQYAFFIPMHVSTLRNVRREEDKIDKFELDFYQFEEMEQNLCLAMEFTYQIGIKIWIGGFFKEYRGVLHRMDEINKVIYLESREGIINKISMLDMFGVEWSACSK